MTCVGEEKVPGQVRGGEEPRGEFSWSLFRLVGRGRWVRGVPHAASSVEVGPQHGPPTLPGSEDAFPPGGFKIKVTFGGVVSYGVDLKVRLVRLRFGH